MKPSFAEEKILWRNGLRYIAGLDEVGRGCFAGPLVAAAVILPKNLSIANYINDSKKLTFKKRVQFAEVIKKEALSFSIAEVDVTTINKLGISKATQQAFKLAIEGLSINPDFILSDAYSVEAIDKTKQKAIIKGDSISISIAAASIIAKVYRDELMSSLDPKYECYKFSVHKGYGTKLHQQLIYQYGLSDLHRSSFNLKKFLKK